MFTRKQLELARTLPKRFTLGVLASVTDTDPDMWRRLMDAHDGPDYQTTVGGVTVYGKRDVLRWMGARTVKGTEAGNDGR